MKTSCSVSKLRKGRLVRLVALLFLLHAGVDLLLPQLCTEETVQFDRVLFASKAIGIDQKLTVSAASLPHESGEDQRPAQPRDEDCFCCCTHVMASLSFVN